MKYDMKCNKCDSVVEIEMPADEYMEKKNSLKCEVCGETLERVWSPILRTNYNCRGFYDTDNRGKEGR